MKIVWVLALFGGVILGVGLADASELSVASHVPAKPQTNRGLGSEMSYDQGSLWTLDYGPSYDLSRPEDEDPLAGIPIGTVGVAKGKQVTR
jgi:hypothetical protein